MKFILRLFSRFKKKIRQISSNFCILKFFFIFSMELRKKLMFSKIFKYTQYIREKNYFTKKNFLIFFFFLKNFKSFRILWFIRTFFVGICLNYVQIFNLHEMLNSFFKEKFQRFSKYLAKLKCLYEKNFDFTIKKIKKM
mmetsp:Transcript_74481/g.199082  ORF Transcript_74481/g.199082 Transcript_74481/m.199082 type:complete len:139 (-) Transcript_74481:615-1031(-)